MFENAKKDFDSFLLIIQNASFEDFDYEIILPLLEYKDLEKRDAVRAFILEHFSEKMFPEELSAKTLEYKDILGFLISGNQYVREKTKEVMDAISAEKLDRQLLTFLLENGAYIHVKDFIQTLLEKIPNKDSTDNLTGEKIKEIISRLKKE